MEVKRGDLIAVALSGDYGKPRPALIVQADHFAELPSVTILPLTSELRSEHLLRVTVEPNRQNGLRSPSQIMVDKLSTISRARTGKRIGHLDARTMQVVDGALAKFLALA
ncbi:MAG TPA: type II toxin-antitoxin system PemK/MazF family toxin [Rhizomicrobium sp.]|nr:type II toxin-antitoxin system PemK/MazF family toxin [Rhizomicrobium sp.]